MEDGLLWSEAVAPGIAWVLPAVAVVVSVENVPPRDRVGADDDDDGSPAVSVSPAVSSCSTSLLAVTNVATRMEARLKTT